MGRREMFKDGHLEILIKIKKLKMLKKHSN
jgi:hypothetical protein